MYEYGLSYTERGARLDLGRLLSRRADVDGVSDCIHVLGAHARAIGFFAMPADTQFYIALFHDAFLRLRYGKGGTDLETAITVRLFCRTSEGIVAGDLDAYAVFSGTDSMVCVCV